MATLSEQDEAAASHSELEMHLRTLVTKLRLVAGQSRWGRVRTLRTPLPVSPRWVIQGLQSAGAAGAGLDSSRKRSTSEIEHIANQHTVRRNVGEDVSIRGTRNILVPFPNTDIVVARCTEPISEWLPPLVLHLPANVRVRVFLYEMCSDAIFDRRWAEPWAYWLDIPIMRQPLENRGFESAAYLQHIIQAMRSQDVADATLFLQVYLVACPNGHSL